MVDLDKDQNKAVGGYYGVSIRLPGANTRLWSSKVDLDKDRETAVGRYYGVSIWTWGGILRRRGVTL